MSDENEEPDEEFGFEVQLPHPGSISSLFEDGKDEADLVFVWLDAAREDGSIGQEETVSLAGFNSILSGAKRNQKIPAELSSKDALILLAYWIGFAGGFNFNGTVSNITAAHAMAQISKTILGRDDEEDDE